MPPNKPRLLREQKNAADGDAAIASAGEIIADVARGRMVVLVDDKDRENEGDLLIAAQFADAQAINFMARHARGLICLTLTGAHCRRLGLAPMSADNGAAFGTNFTVSIEAARGVSTGISASDRATTIRAAARPEAVAADIVTPGHIFPVEARDGGVLVRAGHTEAGCDLARLAGLFPAAVICEILKEDGEMARLPDLVGFAAEHNLKIGAIESLIRHRSRTESLIREISAAPLATPWGEFKLRAFSDVIDGGMHIALCRGEWDAKVAVPVRVVPEASVLDALANGGIGRSWSANAALRHIAAQGRGVLLFLNAGGGGALAAQVAGLEDGGKAKPRDLPVRTYGIGAQILQALGVGKIRLLSSRLKLPSMAGFGLEIVDIVAADEKEEDGNGAKI
jgi:3,4-dihydroxy 2-butanone 4-phosphate synthase/GTP cyclohydrolase II